MEKIRIAEIKTPAGELLAGEWKGQLCLLDWKYRKMRDAVDRRIQSGLAASYVDENTDLFDELRLQLTEYFAGKRKDFQIPLLTVGTGFQKEVWDALQTIPYGKTESYGDLARMMGKDRAVRAVASANGANGISILIPCHRIIGSRGDLGGYAGGLPAKKKLLELEQQLVFDI